MEARPVYIASDLHLGSAPEGTEAAFLSWLEHCASNASQVIINGDLFDFWFEYRSVIPRGHTRVLGALAALVDAGIPVLYLGGNHDWWGGSYLREEIGVDFRQDPIRVDLQGKRTLLAHGDGVGGGDLGYRMLKLVLRGRLTRLAFRWLHPDLGAWVARRVSKTDSRTGEPLEKQLARSRFLEEWAVARLEADPELHLVSLGHTHVPLLREVDPGRHYVNSGDWLVNRSYVVLERKDPPRLFQWGDRGPGRPLGEAG
jgi:UDP-2,3-diacylglucosamine hydrolase